MIRNGGSGGGDEVLDAVVVGGGISGLSCAERLHRDGASVRVLEASDRVGGKMGSDRTADGYVLEAGPHEVRSGDPEMLEQFRELGIEADRIRARPAVNKRYVVSDGRPRPLPSSPLGVLTTDVLSLRAKLRILGEPFVSAGAGDDESVAGFFGRRLGWEVAEGPLDAFVSGVYAGDADDISMRAAFPALLEGERTHGSLLRWGVHRLRNRQDGDEGSDRSPELFSFRGGLGSWPRALAAALGPERVWTSAAVREVSPDPGGGWSVEVRRRGRRHRLRARHLVLAVPAPTAGRLLAETEPAAARALGTVPYAPVAVVHLAYPEGRIEHPLDGFGVLAPGREGRDVLGILWVSSLFEGRAPDGMALTASFVGGARRPELPAEDDEALVGRVVQEHRDLLGASGAPDFAHVHRWDRAIPQYDMGHPERTHRISRAEEERPGLHLTGNYRSGVGIPATWSDGRRAAAEILAELESVGPDRAAAGEATGAGRGVRPAALT